MTEEEAYHQKQLLRPLKTIDEQTKRIALLRAENDALRKAWLDLWNKAGRAAGTPER
jgi:flagellar motility protein MotE (MotC chaperone)